MHVDLIDLRLYLHTLDTGNITAGASRGNASRPHVGHRRARSPGAGSVGVSYLIAGIGGGALLASVFLAGVRSDSVRGKLFLFFAFTSGLGPMLLAWSDSSTLSIAATVVMGANQAGFMTISHTIIQSLTEDHVRGRVAGVYSVHVGGSMAVTNMANAAFADVFNASSVMVFGGLIFVAAVFVSLGSGSLRKLYFPGAVPAAVGASTAD